jgi:hypothetical protein
MPIVVMEPSGPCWTSGRSSHRLSKGIASGSAIYSPYCSRQPSRSLGHLLGSDGWSPTKEEDYLGRRAAALRREGDFVIIHGRFSGTGLPRNWIAADVVRIADGVLAEHWEVLQDEAARAESKSGLPMFGDSFTD